MDQQVAAVKALNPDDGTLYLRKNEMRVKVSSTESGGAYEICEERCPPGFASRHHSHNHDFESFIVIEGSAKFLVGDDVIDAKPGMVIHIPPGVPHKVSTEEGIRMFLIFGPGSQEPRFEEMKNMTPEQKADPEYDRALAARYEMTFYED